MNLFIYDNYGYIVNDNEFAFQYSGWDFALIPHQKSEKELYDLDMLVNDIDEILFKQGVSILRNNKKLYASLYEDKVVSLVGIKNFNVGIQDIILMHKQYIIDNPVTYNFKLSKVKTNWIEKIESIQNEIIPYIPNDIKDYEFIISSLHYFIGLGENAISYLEDLIIDYGENLSQITIAHKRIKYLNSFILLNPFNLVLDSPLRDLSELYKNEIIDNNKIIGIIPIYNLNIIDISYLFARILFPSNIFDIIEDYINGDKNTLNEYIYEVKRVNKKMEDIKNLHHLLVDKFLIRPIEWISNL